MTSPPSRPKIALTTYFTTAAWGVWKGEAAIVPAQYINAVTAAGGTPVLLPPTPDGPDAAVLDIVDGLVLVGGNDVDPGQYGAVPHPDTVSDPRRDAQETSLARAALDRGLPLLAICRGAQVLNVTLGGSLHQHLPDVLGHSEYRPAPAKFGRVEVHTEPGSKIASILGESAEVRCYHHQGIDRVAPALTVTARSADGLVQAVEPVGDVASGWAVGVQFHPEERLDDGRLFEAFVAAARENSHLSTRQPTPQPAQHSTRQETLTP